MPDKPKETSGQQPDSSFIQLDDQKQKGAASAASTSRRKALLGVLTAACTILIVVSLGFVHPSTSGAWSIDWIIQSVTGESVVSKDDNGSGSSTASGEASSKDSKSSDAAKDESKGSNDAKDDSESSDKESDKNSDSKKSEDQDGKKSGDKSAAQNTGAGDTSKVSGGASSGGGQSSNGASSSNGGNASSGGQSGSQESNYVTVTVRSHRAPWAILCPLVAPLPLTKALPSTMPCARWAFLSTHMARRTARMSPRLVVWPRNSTAARAAGCTPSTAQRP